MDYLTIEVEGKAVTTEDASLPQKQSTEEVEPTVEPLPVEFQANSESIPEMKVSLSKQEVCEEVSSERELIIGRLTKDDSWNFGLIKAWECGGTLQRQQGNWQLSLMAGILHHLRDQAMEAVFLPVLWKDGVTNSAGMKPDSREESASAEKPSHDQRSLYQ
eukprot:bmy_13992T0